MTEPAKILLALLLFTLLVLPTVGAVEPAAALRNWPAWRGPLANGVAPSGDPPIEWSETKNVRWKVQVPGRGTATPIVWDDQVFVLTAVPTGKKGEGKAAAGETDGPMRGMVETPDEVQQFTVLALDRATGKTRWQRVAREQLPLAGHHKDHGYASGSPVTDGTHLIAYFGSYGLFCYDLQGNVVWQKDLGALRTRNNFGEGTSPALCGNTLLVLRDHEGDDCLLALDKRDGRELWRQTRDEPTGWCTPLVIEHAGQRQVVVNGTYRIRSYDFATGQLLWECAGMTANAIPSAVADPERVYVTSGFRGSACLAIKPGRTGDLTGTDAIAWSLNRNTPYVPSPLLYGDRLYLFSGNNALLSVVDAPSGKVLVDAQRLEGMFGVYASPAGAADRVYVAGRDGNTFVLKKADTVEFLARNKLDDGFDASPAIVGSELFLRGRANLYCLAAAAEPVKR